MTQQLSTLSCQSTDYSDDERNMDRIDLRPFSDVKLTPTKFSRRISKPFKVASFRTCLLKPFSEVQKLADVTTQELPSSKIETKESMEQFRATVSISAFQF